MARNAWRPSGKLASKDNNTPALVEQSSRAALAALLPRGGSGGDGGSGAIPGEEAVRRALRVLSDKKGGNALKLDVRCAGRGSS